MKTRHTIAAILTATLLGLTACVSPEPTPAAPATATVEPAPTLTPDDTNDMTQIIVDITWDETSEADRNSMCDGIDLFGPEWAADEMEDGAGDESVDWDRAAELVETKCAQR